MSNSIKVKFGIPLKDLLSFPKKSETAFISLMVVLVR